MSGDHRDRERRHAAALAARGPVEPTPEEARNGWTAETLTAYVAEREAAQALVLDRDFDRDGRRGVANRPARQNNRYSPHRWRA